MAKFNKTTKMAAFIAVALIAFLVVFGATGGNTAKFYGAVSPTKTIGSGSTLILPASTGTISRGIIINITVGLKVDETIIFNGKTIKLLNVASGASPQAIVVDVDGVQQTVSGTEIVNGIKIKVEATLYNSVKSLRYAIITLGAESGGIITGTTVGLEVDETTTFSGKTIKLLNVGSGVSPSAIVIDVDGVQQTVSGTEKVNGITIKVEATVYHNTRALRYAIITLS